MLLNSQEIQAEKHIQVSIIEFYSPIFLFFKDITADCTIVLEKQILYT